LTTGWGCELPAAASNRTIAIRIATVCGFFIAKPRRNELIAAPLQRALFLLNPDAKKVLPSKAKCRQMREKALQIEVRVLGDSDEEHYHHHPFYA
jgi:hypothetical protein